MTWMNEHEIDHARRAFDKDDRPNLHKAAEALGRLKDWTNSNSDGWPFWKLPAKAAAGLMAEVDAARIYGRPGVDMTDARLEQLLRSVEKFLISRDVTPADVLYPPPPAPAERRGILLTREQLEAWACRTLSEEEIDALDEAIPNSSIPDAVSAISDTLPGVEPDEDKKDELPVSVRPKWLDGKGF